MTVLLLLDSMGTSQTGKEIIELILKSLIHTNISSAGNNIRVMGCDSITRM